MDSNLDVLYAELKADPEAAESAFWAAVRHRLAIYLSYDEDATQDAVVRVIEALPVYKPRPGVSIVHWLSRIARNVRIDACRKLQARREVQFPVDPDGNEIDLSPVVRNSLVIFPDSLQGTDRQLAELLLAGFTIAEASAKAGLSAAAGRKRFQRIREKYSSRAVTLTKS